ncbi:hypothetical protein ABZ819_05685 [Streptomyces venezuelae]|uniref:hypothetical protein n=1 Tax=Streptomyces venezuelae TaxID=54571 RepID=UPI00342A558C
MSNSSSKVTEAQVREKAAEIRGQVGRWEKVEGVDLATLDVEALARGVLEVRARPTLSGRDLLKAVRPQWEKKAEQQELTGEAREAFIRAKLDEDTPQVFIETENYVVVTIYAIHLNRAAAEVVVEQTEVVIEALEAASAVLEEFDEFIAPLEALLRAEATTIQEVASSQANGQVQLVGVVPSPIFIPEADDCVWNALGGLFGG